MAFKSLSAFTRSPTTPLRIDASAEIDSRAMSPFAAEFLDKITGAEIKVNAHGVSDGYLYQQQAKTREQGDVSFGDICKPQGVFSTRHLIYSSSFRQTVELFSPKCFAHNDFLIFLSSRYTLKKKKVQAMYMKTQH